MCGEWIRSDHSLFLDLERDFGDDCIIRQTGCIKMQDAAKLFVPRVIVDVECRCVGIQRTAHIVCFSRFENPAILRAS